MFTYIAHRDCNNPVSFDPDDISLGAEELDYFAACLYCDVDLYRFETVELVTDNMLRHIA